MQGVCNGYNLVARARVTLIQRNVPLDKGNAGSGNKSAMGMEKFRQWPKANGLSLVSISQNDFGH